MTYQSLRDFIIFLEKNNQLVRVIEPVSINLEMTEIQTRLLSNNGPAVLFENVIDENNKKYHMPVLINLFGTVERVANGMNRNFTELRDLGKTIAFLKNPEPPNNFKQAIKMLPSLAKNIMSMRPTVIKNAPCQEIIFRDEK